MKTLDEIKIQLEPLKPVLKEKFQVETIGIFGSYSQGQQNQKSDVDILVTFSKPNNIDLLDFIALKQFLSRNLKTKVDLVEKDALKIRIKDRILQETIDVWEIPKLYFEDILKAIKEVEEFKKNLSFDDFSKDTKVIRAVTMNFIIIGEASKHVPTEMRKRYPQIPWSKIVAMRNILTHDYPEINIEIIWKTAKKRLPVLKPVIEESLNEQ